MSSHRIRRAASWSIWLALLMACGPEAPARSVRPSFLLVTLDTTRADRLGAYGHGGALTPTLDALAREGILFERALAATPITLPSHASILTGVDPRVHGVRDNGIFVLGPQASLVSEALREAGWRTGAFVGSYVLDAKFGLDQGFEVYRGPPVSHTLAGYAAERSAGAVVDDALRWLGTLAPNERFFAWVHLYDPHEPYAPPPPWSGRLRDPYDAEIAYCDAQLARLLEALERQGRGPELLLAVTADHGESLGEHGERTHGVFVYQSTLHVPLILWGAALGPARGSRVGEIVSNAELAPTLLALAGLPTGGRTLLEEGPRSLYVESRLPYHSLRWRALRGLVWQEHKLVEGARHELYDLRRDPGEEHDLAADDPERVAALRRRLEGMRADGGDASWASPRALDAADRSQLEALGYLAGSGGGDPLDPALPDPRARIGDLAVLERAGVALEASAALTNSAPAATAWQNAERRAEVRRRLEAARGELRSALAGNPGNFQLGASLGAVETRLGHVAEAIRLLEEARRVQPTALDNLYNLADAYQRADRTRDALRTIDEIHRADPDFLPVYMWMSSYHASRDEYGQAVGWMQELARRTRADPVSHREVEARLAALSAAMHERGQEPVPPSSSAADARPRG
jgi:arylsulfatase A-like enzyme